MNAPLLLILAVAASAGPYDRPAGNPDTVWGKNPLMKLTVTVLDDEQLPKATEACHDDSEASASCRRIINAPKRGGWRRCTGILVGRGLLVVVPASCGLPTNIESRCGTSFFLASADPSKPDHPANLATRARSLTRHMDRMAVYHLSKPLGRAALSDKALASGHIGLAAASKALGYDDKQKLVEHLDEVFAPDYVRPGCPPNARD